MSGLEVGRCASKSRVEKQETCENHAYTGAQSREEEQGDKHPGGKRKENVLSEKNDLDNAEHTRSKRSLGQVVEPLKGKHWGNLLTEIVNIARKLNEFITLVLTKEDERQMPGAGMHCPEEREETLWESRSQGTGTSTDPAAAHLRAGPDPDGGKWGNQPQHRRSACVQAGLADQSKTDACLPRARNPNWFQLCLLIFTSSWDLCRWGQLPLPQSQSCQQLWPCTQEARHFPPKQTHPSLLNAQLPASQVLHFVHYTLLSPPCSGWGRTCRKQSHLGDVARVHSPTLLLLLPAQAILPFHAENQFHLCFLKSAVFGWVSNSKQVLALTKCRTLMSPGKQADTD